MQEKSKFYLCGDVLSIRDEDDKEVGSYEYDAYGNVLAVEGNIAKDNPIRYAGYYYDEETKNYYLQARYYNSEKNKRIFSIGYHSISLVDKKTNKKVPKSVWHYHLGRHKLDKKGKQMKGTGGYVHHIFRWSMPKGYKIQNNSNYKCA
ncbi:RHS repeat domain-containing protein [Peribacillus muralis]|uniref:RHS repeat domain-containing protein n=1 Tax=Peribacillus muralis TaxID=264697 RepID=UPI003D009CBD